MNYHELYELWYPDVVQRRDDKAHRVRLPALSRHRHRLEVRGPQRPPPL